MWRRCWRGQPAAEFPERAIEFVIPFGAGGGADIEGRLLAKEMSKVLGQPVVAVNKPGAGGAVTYTYVKNAKPDGYVVAWNSTSILTTTNIGNVNFGALGARPHWSGRVSAHAVCRAWRRTVDVV